MDSNVLENFRKVTISRLGSDPQGKFDLLICLVSNQESFNKVFHVLRPPRVLALFTEEFRGIADQIHAGIAPEFIAHTSVIMRPCDSVNPADIYKAVDDGLDEMKSATPLLDITGGKKVMSAAAALAAWRRNVQACYLDSDYDQKNQRIPGTERLIILPNPLELFGNKEVVEASEAFTEGNFASARERFLNLSNLVQPPPLAGFMADASEFFRAWCDFDIDSLKKPKGNAGQPLEKLRRHLQSPTALNELKSTNNLARFKAQIDLVERLVANEPAARLASFHILGEHYLSRGRHDFATLFFYRCAEGCFTERIIKQYGVSPRMPEYDKFPITDIKGKLQALSAIISDQDYPEYRLPHDLGFIAAALVLHLLKDDLAVGILDTIDGVKHLYSLSQRRNQSVLAHGNHPVSKEDAEAVRDKSRAVLDRYLELEDGKNIEIDNLKIPRKLCQKI